METGNHSNIGSRIINQPLAFHLRDQNVENIPFCRDNGQPLPETLIIPPGIYRVHDCSYRLTEEGLYRFMDPGVDNQQRVVYQSEPWAFVSALSWLSSHGSRDNGKNIADQLKIAMREKLIVTCGNMSAFGQQLLSEHGIPARVVGTKTLGRLNKYDTGHVLVEVNLAGKWTLVDLDLKFLFRRHGRRLSLLEAVEAVAEGDYQLEPLAQAVVIAVSNYVLKGQAYSIRKEGYDYGLWMETMFFSQSAIRKWYRRIMMIPIIPDSDGKSYSTALTDNQRMKAQCLWKDFTYLPRDDFIRRFYKD